MLELQGAIWFRAGKQDWGGKDRIALLAAIGEHGSITAAARAVGISYGKADQIAIPEAMEPVLAAVHERSALHPGAHVEVLAGDYDHRFPVEVAQQIGDRLLAWSRD